MLLLELQAGFERVGVRLVDLAGQIGFFDPWPEAAILNWESRAGTCLMATTIFIQPPWPLYSRYRLKIRQPLVPPKPKLLDSAYSIFMGRAWFGT